MSRFLSEAIGRLFKEHDALASAGRIAGRLAHRKPSCIEEIRDLQDLGGTPVIRWSLMFRSRDEAVEFDGAVRKLIAALAEEGK